VTKNKNKIDKYKFKIYPKNIFNSLKMKTESIVVNESRMNRVKEKYNFLKSKSGSHSPSALLIQKEIPEVKLTIDCCFLSNPYATDAFMKRLKTAVSDEKWLYNQIESYPAQNVQIAELVARSIGIKSENIFIGNGATEAISAILNNFIKGKILIMLPTFSPYYEYINKETTMVHYFPMIKGEDKFYFDIDNLICYCTTNEINNIVLINPNNPDGSLVTKEKMKELLKRLDFMDNIILDESFIEFAGTPESVIDSFYEYKNLTIIRSMSKIFGIAGIRAGFCITKKEYVSKLLENGFLWNSNCFAIFFFELLNDKEFMEEYEKAKDKYNKELEAYYEELEKCNSKIKFYKSKANFFLGELIDKQKTVEELMLYLLCEHGIYIRQCADKKGLSDRFFRISSRNEEENKKIVEAFKQFN
jgi:histidinol-phosphate/aromatic aminotransferase/cobyric acid decarboxylase-like protein